MRTATRPVIVLLGMMSKMPDPGVVWQTMHYVVGLERLGWDVHYVEAHGVPPIKLMTGPGDDPGARASAFIAGVMERFGLGDRWAYHDAHGGGRCYGMTSRQLDEVYRSAEALLNLHGGTEPLPVHADTGRLIYLETDPVQIQIELHHGVERTAAFLAAHRVHFTFGENYGHPDCRLPMSAQFSFRPTRQPVVLDFWRGLGGVGGDTFTTIGNWHQSKRELVLEGEVYYWSKDYEFRKVLDLPARTGEAFELALSSSSYGEDDRCMLEQHGWRVRDALGFARDIDAYRDYIGRSRGEFTVAKDQNVRLRSGWFSDRSATYLAAGRPVITQETGFSNVLPTGEGLFAFTTVEEAAEAVRCVNADYERHCRAAAAIAREYFDSAVVLGALLRDAGLPARVAA
jgi:hypothetical protein